MTMQDTAAQSRFVATVNRSFLSDKDKARFIDAAKAGVSQDLWDQVNDRLIATIVSIQGQQKQYTKNLDEEIDRYTKEYESVKTSLDLQLRKDLQAVKAEDTAGREEIWTAYRKKIRDLQSRLLREVKNTSSSILKDVVLATVRTDHD